MSASQPRRATHDARIEGLRVFAALCVFVYHFTGDTQRILEPAWRSSLLWKAAMEWTGPLGVGIFIAVSGVVGAWSIRRRGSAAPGFVKSRLTSLFLPYWWVAVPLMALAVAAGALPASELWKAPVWLSGLGIVSRATFFPPVDAWWYMTLALQMAIALPWVYRAVDRIGAVGALLLAALVAAVTCRLVADTSWSYLAMGLLPARAFEFVTGIVIGNASASGARLRASSPALVAMLAGAAVLIVADPALAIPRVIAVAMLVAVLAAIDRLSAGATKVALAGGSISYAFFLSHSPWARPVLTALANTMGDVPASVAGAAVSLAVAVAVATGFTASYAFAQSAWARAREQRPNRTSAEA